MISISRTAPAVGSAKIRCSPEDFVVEELLELKPEPAGEHLWLRVQKRGENTEYVARLLARAAEVDQRAVGYAGRKDRHALTTQWFSVQLPGRPDPDFRALPPSVVILEAQRRNRKLQTGALQGNRFRLVLRDFEGDRDALERRLLDSRGGGVPNYFGEQRFGRDASNLERALALFRGELRVRDRSERGLLLSAARSALFNAILARRVAQGSWCSALAGDLMVLDGSRSFFAVAEPDATLAERLARGDIHPSGALWGRGEPGTTAAAGELERAVAAGMAQICAGLAKHGLEQERRPLRLMPRDMTWCWLGESVLELEFRLDAGGFATTVLADLLEVEDAGRVDSPPGDQGHQNG